MANVELHGMNIGFHAINASFNESLFTGIDTGSVTQLAVIDSGSTSSNISFVGSIMQVGTNGSYAPAVDYEGTCTGSAGGAWMFSGGTFVSQAGVFTLMA